jgi:hypothetical protein
MKASTTVPQPQLRDPPPMAVDDEIVALFDAFERCDAPIGNYYGTPTLIRQGGRWMLALQAHAGTSMIAVSGEFALAWLAEFDGKAPVVERDSRRLITGLDSPWAREGED